MPKFAAAARGIAYSKASATRGGSGKFTPTFKWDEGETKYLQFLTPLDDIVTLLMHRFIIVGQRDDGNPIYETFISRRDPNLDGPDGYDPLIDRFDVQPQKRSLALAVELEPEFEGNGSRKKIAGFEVAYRQFKNKEDEIIEVPNVALVNESPYTLFDQVAALADMGQELVDKVYAVKRNGKGTDTSYTLLPVADALDLEEELDEFFENFDFDAYLEDLADEDKMHDLIDPLPDDAVVVKSFGNKKKGKKSTTSSTSTTSTRSRRTRAEAEPEPDVEDESGEADENDVEAATPRRTRKFSDLKRTSSR